jgi:hypothetical protein
MEAEDRASAMTPSAASEGHEAGARRGWIVGPVFDLLFFANLGWLVALVPGIVAADNATPLQFWQIYFLTTPHRWITLVLVAADPSRREGRTWLFVALALLAAVVVAGVWLSTGAFLCLLLIDYLWNGWHFASQHAGVLRIYSRKAGGGRPWLEREGLRFFIFYTIARTAGWSTGWLEGVSGGMDALHALDLCMLVVPALLLALELKDGLLLRLPKMAYLVSVSGLYSALLLALRGHHAALILSLAAAGALFHAVEYLALVTHYAWRQSSPHSAQASGSEREPAASLFRQMAERWLAFLAAYLVLLGLCAWLMEGLEFWLGLNLWAAFLHYAYDGLIWKLRRPTTAQALGAELPAAL